MKLLVMVVAFGLMTGTASEKDASVQNVDLAVTENGFDPKSIDVKPGGPPRPYGVFIISV